MGNKSNETMSALSEPGVKFITNDDDDYRPATSPYGDTLCQLYFKGQGPLYVPYGLLHISPVLADGLGENNILELEDLSLDTGHVMIHYLYRGRYQCLKPEGQTAQDKRTAEFATSLRAYSAARVYRLPRLRVLATRQIKRLGDGLSLPCILEVLHDVHPNLCDEDEWLETYLTSRTRSELDHLDRPKAETLLVETGGATTINMVLLRAVVSRELDRTEALAEELKQARRELDVHYESTRQRTQPGSAKKAPSVEYVEFEPAAEWLPEEEMPPEKPAEEEMSPEMPAEEEMLPEKLAEEEMPLEMPAEEEMLPEKLAEEEMPLEKPAEEEMPPEMPVEEEMLPEKPVEEEMLPEKLAEEEMPLEKPAEEEMSPEMPVEKEMLLEKPVEEEMLPERPAEEEKPAREEEYHEVAEEDFYPPADVPPAEDDTNSGHGIDYHPYDNNFDGSSQFRQPEDSIPGHDHALAEQGDKLQHESLVQDPPAIPEPLTLLSKKKTKKDIKKKKKSKKANSVPEPPPPAEVEEKVEEKVEQASCVEGPIADVDREQGVPVEACGENWAWYLVSSSAQRTHLANHLKSSDWEGCSECSEYLDRLTRNLKDRKT